MRCQVRHSRTMCDKDLEMMKVSLTGDIMASVNGKLLIWICFIKNMFQKSTNLNWKPFFALDFINTRPDTKHISKTFGSHLIDFIKIREFQDIWTNIDCFTTNYLVAQLGKPYSRNFFGILYLFFVRFRRDFSYKCLSLSESIP